MTVLWIVLCLVLQVLFSFCIQKQENCLLRFSQSELVFLSNLQKLGEKYKGCSGELSANTQPGASEKNKRPKKDRIEINQPRDRN